MANRVCKSYALVFGRSIQLLRNKFLILYEKRSQQRRKKIEKIKKINKLGPKSFGSKKILGKKKYLRVKKILG